MSKQQDMKQMTTPELLNTIGGILKQVRFADYRVPGEAALIELAGRQKRTPGHLSECGCGACLNSVHACEEAARGK